MKPITLKLTLLGAALSLGVMAEDAAASRMKDDAEFVQKAAMSSKTQVELSELALTQSANPSVKKFAEKVIADHRKAFDSLNTISSTQGIQLPFQSIGHTATGTTGSAMPTGKDVSKAGEKAASDVAKETSKTAGEVADSSKSAAEGAAAGAKKAADETTGAGKAAAEEVASASKKTADEVAASSKKAADDVASGTKKAASESTGVSKEYAKASEKAQEKYNDLSKLSGEKFDKAYLSDISSENKKAISLVEKESKDGFATELRNWASSTLPTLQQQQEMAKVVKEGVENQVPSM